MRIKLIRVLACLCALMIISATPSIADGTIIKKGNAANRSVPFLIQNSTTGNSVTGQTGAAVGASVACVQSTSTGGSTASGSTTLVLTSATGFPASGSISVASSNAPTQTGVITYTGISTNTLTGIPASGAGSISATIPNGSLVTNGIVNSVITITWTPNNGTYQGYPQFASGSVIEYARGEYEYIPSATEANSTSDLHYIASSSGNLDYNFNVTFQSYKVDDIGAGLIPTQGTCTTGSSSVTINTTLTAPSANCYKGEVIVFTGGTAANIGAAYLISANTAVSNASVITVLTAPGTAPASGDTFDIVVGVGQKVVDMLAGNLNIAANVTQVAGQTANASGAVTFPGSIGTSTLTQSQVTGGAYALNTDGSGNIKVSSGTGANQISLSSGAVTVGTLPAAPANFLTSSAFAAGTQVPSGYLTNEYVNIFGAADTSFSSSGTIGYDVKNSLLGLKPSGATAPSWWVSPTGAVVTTSATDANIAGSVLNALAGSYNSANTIGNKINNAASAGNPFSTLISGGGFTLNDGTFGGLILNETALKTSGATTPSWWVSPTGAAVGSVTGAVGSVTGSVTVGAINSGVTVPAGYFATASAPASGWFANSPSGTDPWLTALPGSYTSGQAGNILGTVVQNALKASGATAPSWYSSGGGPTVSQIATGVWTDLLANGSDFTTNASIGKYLAGSSAPTWYTAPLIDGSGYVKSNVYAINTGVQAPSGFLSNEYTAIANQVLATPVDATGSTITLKQANEISTAIQAGKFSVSYVSGTRTQTTTYYKADGVTVIVTSVVVFDTTGRSISKTMTFSNL